METDKMCVTGFMSKIIAAEFWQALENGSPGSVYNLGARNERRNIEVVESLLDSLGKPRSLIRFVKDRLGHDRRYAIDPSLAETELGWRPKETWESGLRKLLNGTRRIPSGLNELAVALIADYYKQQYGTEVGRLRVLVTGAGGLVGRSANDSLPSVGDDVLGSIHESSGYHRC